ncbi:hypothetical protein O181_076815 [Austropuccinia psidii MF-1]|uniref:Integrase catalytic domain-containing protein n=1 Tax=Austropuccinia psidii MF-1 TaxID=1389203 RepID=A0A9Q3IFE2_9BASI|nr:hypothetical protein [Austropuccinia psidii MF-1]
MGPFDQAPQGFQYLLTIRDHISTFSIIYPLKSRLDTPAAVLDAITHLTVQLETSPKALQTDNTREFTSGSVTTALAKLGIGFYPSLPYLPQENGEAECLNQTLGDMARAMLTKSDAQIPRHTRYCTDGHPLLLPYTHLGKGPSYMFQWSNSHASWMQGALSANPSSCYWPPANNQMIHLESAIFPHFQTAQSAQETPDKGSLRHVLNAMTLANVPTEIFFVHEERAINYLLLEKDITIPENLKQASLGTGLSQKASTNEEAQGMAGN